jgi:hypothetical protein
MIVLTAHLNGTGQFQAQIQVEVSGGEAQIAKDFLDLIRVLGIGVDPDFGLEVRGHFGAAPHELTG